MPAHIVRRTAARARALDSPRQEAPCARRSSCCWSSASRRARARALDARPRPSAGYAALVALFAEWRAGPAAAGRGGRARLHARRRSTRSAQRLAALRARLARDRRRRASRASERDRPRARRGRDERARLRPARAAALVAQPGLLRDGDRRAERHAGCARGRRSRARSSCGGSRCRCPPPRPRALAAAAAGDPARCSSRRAPTSPGDARDLWRVGIRSAARAGRGARRVRREAAPAPPGAGAGRRARARGGRRRFAPGSSAGSPAKHGRSGVGRENYDWYLRNVHRLPYTWQDELVLMERELARALAHLALEEHKNRALPPLEPAASAAEWQQRADAALAYYMRFLREQQVLTRARTTTSRRCARGSAASCRPRSATSSPRWTRASRCCCAATATTGSTSRAWSRSRTRARSAAVPLLYNIWDGRAEGLATGDGGADDERGALRGAAAQPRARLRHDRAARRARDRGAAHALERVDARARRCASPASGRRAAGCARTARPSGSSRGSTCQQPGYGTSYLTGKAMIEALLAERARQLGPALHARRLHGRAERRGHDPDLADPRGDARET